MTKKFVLLNSGLDQLQSTLEIFLKPASPPHDHSLDAFHQHSVTLSGERLVLNCIRVSKARIGMFNFPGVKEIFSVPLSCISSFCGILYVKSDQSFARFDRTLLNRV